MSEVSDVNDSLTLVGVRSLVVCLLNVIRNRINIPVGETVKIDGEHHETRCRIT